MVSFFTSKYDSQRIKVNTPNIVMVFSNEAPNTTKLAKDWWKPFFIENDQLEEHNHRRISGGGGGAAAPPSILADYLLGQKMEVLHG